MLLNQFENEVRMKEQRLKAEKRQVNAKAQEALTTKQPRKAVHWLKRVTLMFW